MTDPSAEAVPPRGARSEPMPALPRLEATRFEVEVTEHAARLLATLRRLLGAHDEAQDCFQDAMLSAWRAREGFAGEASVYTWLYRICVNAAFKRLKRRATRDEVDIDATMPVFHEKGWFLEPVAPWEEQAVSRLERDETCARVRACIERLPVDYRAALLLKDIEERSCAEVAELLGISVSNAKIRIHRARQALRALLELELRRAAPTR
ncbi:MAG: sigma-70 family RNA polymerase sigma factor [Planctomycetes bacterium]|nr:sigma-70 family RNA polymerase sigma factor [Planctomycetota bacterium]